MDAQLPLSPEGTKVLANPYVDVLEGEGYPSWLSTNHTVNCEARSMIWAVLSMLPTKTIDWGLAIWK